MEKKINKEKARNFWLGADGCERQKNVGGYNCSLRPQREKENTRLSR